MNYEMNQDVRDLLASLKERNTTKDQKLQTCARINMLASTCGTIDEFTSSWRDVFFELMAGINGRNSIEVKRCLGDTLAHLISFLPYELGWFITHISEEYKNLHPRSDDERVIVINAITHGTQRTFLRRIGGIRDHEFKMELEFVVECLGKNNSRTVLPALLDAFVQLTAFYPDLLEKEKYMEVVDVTIGWLVEQSSPVLVQKCQETLLALKHFWESSHDFAHELIGHFREDIYAYVQDTIEKDDLSCLRKARAVMLTMSTVLGIFVEFGPSEHAEILDIARQVLTSCAEFSSSLQHIHSYQVARFFSSFCTVFATILKMCNNEMAKPIIQASIDETTRLVPLYMYNPNAFSEFMEFLTKANNICELPVEHAENVAEAIVGENGFLRLHDFRSNSRSMCTTISRLVSSLMSKSSMAQLQSSFSLIKSVMVEDATILTNALSSHNLHCHVVQQAEARLIVFVKSLEMFAVVKNSLIAIMGVKPSLLNFLCLELPLTSPGFSMKFPAVHLAILKVIVSHVESHDFFLANSDWLTGVGRGGIIGESVTSKHVQLQMQTISRCLQDGIKWNITRELVCDWLASLVSRIDEKSLAQIVKRKEWKSLRTALINAHMKDDVEESFLEVAKKLAVLNLENDSDAVNVVSALTHKISTMNSLKGVKIRNGIDSKILIRSSVSARGWDAMENRQQRVLDSNFNAADFTLLSDFLLREIAPSRSLNPTEDDLWLFDTIDALYCTTDQNKNNAKFLQKWRWALAQMALHCVENRMKTSLGKPMETFNAIGAEMQRLAKDALGLTEYQKVISPPLETPKMPRKSSNKDEEDDEEYGRARTLTDSEEWWRVRCLLEFIEILDKLMSNASTGFVFPIANVSQLARQFFTANSASCQEWLNRTYTSAMVVAYHNGAYAQVIRFGSSALVDLEKKQQRVDAKSQENDEKESSPVQGPPPSIASAIIGWMARAMVEMGAVQATKGLQKWMKKVYKIEADWLEGAVQMASSRLEDALVSFNKALLDDSLPDTVKTLIRSMIFDILNRLRLPTLLEPAICPPGMSIWSEAEALSSSMPRGFDTDALIKLKQLCTFVKADQVTPNPVRWDVSRSLFTKETQLMQTLRRAEVLSIKDDASYLGTLVLMGDSGLRNQGRIALFEKIVTAVVSKMNKFHNTEAELSPSFLTSGDCYADIGERLSHARRMSFWGERLAGGVCVHEETAILARKTGNEMLAMTLLQKALATVQPGRAAKLRLIAAMQRAKMLWSKGDDHQRSIVWSETFISMAAALQIENQRQQFLILVNQDGNFSNGGMTLNMGGMSNGIDMQKHAPVPGFPIDYESCSEEISKTALRLAEWLTVQPAVQISPEVYPTPLWSQLEAMAVHIGGDVVGSLLALASSITPSLAKAHLRLADWSYNVSTAGIKEKEMFDNNYRVLLGDVQQSVLDGLWKALNTCTALSDLEKTVHNILSYDVTSAKSLLSYGSHYTNLWSQLVQRRSVFLTNAVNSYFAYISQLGSKDESSAGSVSATLRILGLLANHSDILQTHLEEGIAQTNELLWKDILPQLFSRLSHPNRIVRDLIVSLLSKLCTSSPHSVIFQVVSGTASISFVEDSDDVLESDEREDEDTKKEKSLMVDCCRQLEGILQDMYPNLVRDVKGFVNELQKISLLYEEKWTFVLSNLDHEMAKRLEQINIENERTKNATHLDEKTRQEIIAEKAQLITSPVYRILSDLYERTCENPVTTANEEMFVRYFSSDLKAAFDQSKANCKNPEKAWAPFRDILRVLQQKGMRRGTQAFNMDDISTVLTKLHGTCIPLPGQDKVDYSDVLTLEKVGNTAQVLPTKTRPKKMLFVGSDGKEHIYLFKGQEDLHLDERIMQLLNICNLMLGKSSTRDWPAYSARHYAVTPLGTRSGLIQWVGGATPMFQIYRKWQQKQAQIKNSMEKKNGVSVTVTEVERPTDMYQKTIRAAFLKHKIPPEIISDRAKWPQFLLKEVLTTLLKETPKDILSRELWVRAGSSDTWWRVACRLARSSAVMSIIGAILGLGDRHLDNLLVNLDRGEIVHIDYNICFDKGKNLRVPETVPFRLTQNLVHAMGPAQIEGVFRESCYHVMGNLRESREVLLTILEAFVYDPLVDWAAGDHLTTSSAAVSVAVALAVYGSDSRVHEAKPIARNMFTVRTKELAMPWMRNCHELTVALDSVRSILRRQLNIGSSVWDKPETLDQERVEAGRKLKLAIGVHHQMMKDFRPLLRALATCDERFVMFTKRYKELFSEPLIKGHQLLDSHPVNLAACISQFDIVLQHIARIYGDLITLDVSEDHDFENKASQMRNLTPPPGLEDPGMRGGQQEQNAHAKNVVRRVRARLEGRADDSRVILPVEEQVDSLIRQATSTTLLSLMYEGWTAWV